MKNNKQLRFGVNVYSGACFVIMRWEAAEKNWCRCCTWNKEVCVLMHQPQRAQTYRCYEESYSWPYIILLCV